jgi:MFS transporter, ACS family, D-galactonate transporter
MNDTTPDITQDTSVPDPEKAARIAQQPASRKRWLIAMLLFVTVVIN